MLLHPHHRLVMHFIYVAVSKPARAPHSRCPFQQDWRRKKTGSNEYSFGGETYKQISMDSTMLFLFSHAITGHWKITVYLYFAKALWDSKQRGHLSRLEFSNTCASLFCTLCCPQRQWLPHLHRRSPCSCEVRRLQKPPVQLAPRIITRGIHATGTDTIKKWYFPVSRPMPTVDFSVFLRNRQRGDGALLWGLCAKDMWSASECSQLPINCSCWQSNGNAQAETQHSYLSIVMGTRNHALHWFLHLWVFDRIPVVKKKNHFFKIFSILGGQKHKSTETVRFCYLILSFWSTKSDGARLLQNDLCRTVKHKIDIPHTVSPHTTNDLRPWSDQLSLYQSTGVAQNRSPPWLCEQDIPGSLQDDGKQRSKHWKDCPFP